MRDSTSADESGWKTYPREAWDERNPPDKLGDLPFWRYCAEKFGAPVLDLCCGNGRITLPLAQMGYDVDGVDINEGFLDSARRRLTELRSENPGLRIRFLHGDIVNLSLDREYALAILPSWSFQVLLTQEDQISFLRRLRRHLKDGGALAFNLFIPFHRQRGLVERNGRYEWPRDPDYHSGALRTYDAVTQIEEMVESNVHTIKLRHTNLNELRLLFGLTGFEIAELYGDDDMRPFTGAKDNDYTIIARTV